jgi:hypothetical protein
LVTVLDAQLPNWRSSPSAPFRDVFADQIAEHFGVNQQVIEMSLDRRDLAGGVTFAARVPAPRKPEGEPFRRPRRTGPFRVYSEASVRAAPTPARPRWQDPPDVPPAGVALALPCDGSKGRREISTGHGQGDRHEAQPTATPGIKAALTTNVSVAPIARTWRPCPAKAPLTNADTKRARIGF